MPLLNDYSHFKGHYRDTAPIANVLAYQGYDLSENLLFGISGGIAAGYFSFEYAGHAPYVRFLARNTFDPFEEIINRLGIETQVMQTGSAEKAVKHLHTTLEAGQPAIVFADMYSLPYNNTHAIDDIWLMAPIVVYGDEDGTAYVADIPDVPLSVASNTLTSARGRTGKNKHRLLTLHLADTARLPHAVEAGIRQCIQHMTGEPPRKPMRGKYGLPAYQHWADRLTGTTKADWPKNYPPGTRLYDVLKSAYSYILQFSGPDASRAQYADFLDEAANILHKPGLTDAAAQFRNCLPLWSAFMLALLPDAVGMFKQTRELLDREHNLFISAGAESLEARRQIGTQLHLLQDQIEAAFPFAEAEAADLRATLRDHLLAIHNAEQTAMHTLSRIMD